MSTHWPLPGTVNNSNWYVQVKERKGIERWQKNSMLASDLLNMRYGYLCLILLPKIKNSKLDSNLYRVGDNNAINAMFGNVTWL